MNTINTKQLNKSIQQLALQIQNVENNIYQINEVIPIQQTDMSNTYIYLYNTSLKQLHVSKIVNNINLNESSYETIYNNLQINKQFLDYYGYSFIHGQCVPQTNISEEDITRTLSRKPVMFLVSNNEYEAYKYINNKCILNNFNIINQSILLPNFNNANITDWSNMFNNDINKIKELKNITLNMYTDTIQFNDVNTDSTTESDIISKYDLDNQKSISSIHRPCIYNIENISSMFESCNDLTNISIYSYIVNEFNKNIEKIQLSNTTYNTIPHKISTITNMSKLFKNCNKLQVKSFIDFLKIFDMKNVLNTSNTFEGCSLLNTDVIKNIESNKVLDTSNMFKDCTGLINTIQLDKFNLINALNTSYMFYNCNNINKLQLCYNNILPNELPIIDDAAITPILMNNMFENCSKLTSVYINTSDTNTNNVVIYPFTMKGMFKNCNKFTNIISTSSTQLSLIPLLNATYCNDASEMFMNCSSLISLDLTNIHLSINCKLNDIFTGCTSLNEIKCNKNTFDLLHIYLPDTEKWSYQNDKCIKTI